MNRSQTRQLDAYLHFQGQKMTIANLLWFNRRTYVLLLALALASTAAAYYILTPFDACLIATAYAAVFIRDIGYYRKAASVWPLVQQVLDWDKVREFASTGREGVP